MNLVYYLTTHKVMVFEIMHLKEITIVFKATLLLLYCCLFIALTMQMVGTQLKYMDSFDLYFILNNF